jgi:cell wall-associated NlpC family hydrolase
MTNSNNKHRISGICRIIAVCAMILSLFAFIQAQPFCNRVHAADSVYIEEEVSAGRSASDNNSASENSPAAEDASVSPNSSSLEDTVSDKPIEADIPESAFSSAYKRYSGYYTPLGNHNYSFIYSASNNASDYFTMKVDKPHIRHEASGNYTPEEITELRGAIVEYAKQYLGNRYVPAGPTLEGGTDCSGFTCYIFRDFGIETYRTSTEICLYDGRSIDISEAQPGDIVCYGDKECSHVAIYIGNDLIIHSANSSAGVKIGDAYYDNILDVKNVLD